MRNIQWIALLCSLLLLLSACAAQSQPPAESVEPQSIPSVADESIPAAITPPEDSSDAEAEVPEEPGSTVLVAYFSQYAFLADNARAVDGVTSASVAPGDVERIAGMIQEATGADLFEIVAEEPYPADYDAASERARQEMGTRPKLVGTVESMEQYDIIYVGYPVWVGSYPMPMASFLEAYDLSGKTVVPFCAYENYMPDDMWTQVRQLVPESDCPDGYSISLLNARPSTEGIAEWLGNIGLISSDE